MGKYWQALLRECAHHYFLSWGWISTWLKSLPAENDVRLVVGFLDGAPVTAFFAGITKKRKYGIFPTRVVSLNTTGLPYFDKLYLEYNRILVSASTRFSVDELLRAITDLRWDELNLPGLESDFVQAIGMTNPARHRHWRVLIDEKSSAPFVDLEQVRTEGLDYLRLVSSNKRTQIRRSIKEYEKNGRIELVEASNVEQAREFFEELVVLHQKEWEHRGRMGAFSNNYLLQFHRDLIASRFEFGEIQVLKCFNAGGVLGILYNFAYNRRVYFYQSGFNYLSGNVYRPGLVTHYYAILHNAIKGMSAYDFMAGDASYKTSLATISQELYWIRLFRNPLRYYLARIFRSFKSRIIFVPQMAGWARRINDVLLRLENFRRK